MEQAKIDRINELARKHKTEGLTPEETAERHALRQEYIAGFKRSLTHHLDRVHFVDEDGNKEKLKKRGE
ncbi:MAG: DUF896 domain-containing protein [Oscillospiraceae bacterium]|nr:DUF896 domain-containing protein [Oscillospiraceae bacterium]